MSLKKSNFLLRGTPLLLVLFIDGMGLGIVIPILNALIFTHENNFLNNPTPAMQNLLYGGTIGIFMLCWFFGAAMLGDLSDQIGRKKSLLICLLGASIGYFLAGIAVFFHSISLLFLGRIIAGITSGSQPIAQAAIIDISEPENIPRNIGFILLALSLGFIAGPVLGGVLADKQLVHWFNWSTPLYFAALLSLFNALLLIGFFQETFIKKIKLHIKPHRAIEIFVEAFKDKRIKALSGVFFVFILGWSSFYSFVAMYLNKNFNFTPTDISLFMGVLGLGIAIGNGFVVGYVSKRFTLKNNIMVSALLAAICVIAMLSTTNAMYIWALMAPMSCCVSVVYALLVTAFSYQASSEAQGWVMGISGSIMALVWAVAAVVVGLLATFNVAIPLVVAIVCLILTACFVKKLKLLKS
jgi:MFS family permease